MDRIAGTAEALSKWNRNSFGYVQASSKRLTNRLRFLRTIAPTSQSEEEDKRIENQISKTERKRFGSKEVEQNGCDWDESGKWTTAETEDVEGGFVDYFKSLFKTSLPKWSDQWDGVVHRRVEWSGT
ncbi:hypothetical protein U1Q18_045818 [Sarracenia purpurea var. burkii]